MVKIKKVKSRSVKKASSPQEVKFDYIKSSSFRVVHADGAHGGVTPRGKIMMSVFNDRNPIPKQATYAIKDGKLAEELADKRIRQEVVVREVEVGVIMDASVAESVGKWLIDKAKELQGSKKASKKTRKKR